MARCKKEAPAAPPNDEARDLICWRLVFPYGFIDESGKHQFWRSGDVVSNADELAFLRLRGVALEEM